MTLHEGQVWRRIEGTEEALVLLIDDRYVKYRHDRNVNKPPTHTMERRKWSRLFSFVATVLPPPSLPIPAACAELQ